MSWHPIKDEQAVAWELRGAWATGTVVTVRLDDTLHPVAPRLHGRIVYVAVTGAFSLIQTDAGEPWHVPCAAVLAVRKPHFTEPLDAAPPAELTGFPGQLALPLGEEVEDVPA